MNAPAQKIIETPSQEIWRPAPGWYRDISNEQYHRGPGTSSSNLKVLMEQTGEHLQYNKVNPKESTASMALGTAVHALVLEPEKFGESIAVAPSVNKRTNAGKAQFEEFMLENEGKTIVSPEQFEQAQAMANRVLEHPVAGLLLQDIIVESSIYWWYRSSELGDDHRYKEFLKVRPDALSRNYPIVMDLKTVKDGSYSGFIRSIQDYWYHLSAAMYLDGCNQCQPLLDELHHIAFTKFVFICVENFAPYCVSVYELSPEYVALGKQIYRMALYRLSKSREENWPGYPEEVRVIEPPAYAIRTPIV